MINGYNELKRMYPEMDESQRQPAGIDLKVGELYELDDSAVNKKSYDVGLYLDAIGDEIKSNYDIVHCSFDDGYLEYNIQVWGLLPNKPYIVEVESSINIGDTNGQIYFPRSTLIRNGVNVYTAFGDTGYNGKLRFLIINHSSRIFYLGKGVRFCQLVDFEVRNTDKKYDGDYQEEDISW